MLTRYRKGPESQVSDPGISMCKRTRFWLYDPESSKRYGRDFDPEKGIILSSLKKKGETGPFVQKLWGKEKRQLSSIVDMHPDAKVRENGVIYRVKSDEKRPPVIQTQAKIETVPAKTNVEIHVARAQNSPPVMKEKVFREEVYRNGGRAQHNIGIQAAGTTSDNIGDNVSDVSDTSQSFQNELNYLSNELREIKFMLEKFHRNQRGRIPRQRWPNETGSDDTAGNEYRPRSE